MKKIILLALIVGTVSMAMGSHLRCGYITAKPVDCSSRDYMITITVYTSASDVKFGGDGILNFGDGTSNLTFPEVAATPRPDLGHAISMAQFTVRHVFSNLGTFLISYKEPNRNGGVLNMDDSFYTLFYIETSILLSADFGCTTSPEFLAPAVLQAVRGTEFTYSMGVASEEDNLITYELVVPFRDRGLPVVNYVSPGNLAINYLTGLLSWDTNFGGGSSVGEYNFAIQANQHIKIGDAYVKTGFIRIDFQVIVQGDVDEPVSIQDNQELDEYNRLLVPEGDEKKIKVFFESTETSTLQAFSELAETESFAFDTYDSTHEEKTFKVGVLTIHPEVEHIRENPYLVTVRAMSPIANWPLGSDVNYLIYTEEILDLPVIVPPVITDVEQEHDDLEIYPNPARDKLHVHLNQSGISELTLFTIQGQRVIRTSFESETEVNLSDLPAGIYLCEIRRNNFVIRKIKVIKH